MGKSLTTKIVPGSVVATDTTLTFLATSDVPVMRADLLEEQTGRNELKRLTLFRGELRPQERESPGDSVIIWHRLPSRGRGPASCCDLLCGLVWGRRFSLLAVSNC